MNLNSFSVVRGREFFVEQRNSEYIEFLKANLVNEPKLRQLENFTLYESDRPGIF